MTTEIERMELIEVEKVLPNPYQPRKIFDEQAIVELANSMKADGLIQPIVVRETDDGLVLVAGERRLRAAMHLKWHKIKAIVRTMTEAQAAAASIVENFQRVQNNPIEIAEALAVMMEKTGLKQQAVAKMIGVTQAKISQIISLNRLTENLKEQVITGKISPSVGRIISVFDPDYQEKVMLKHPDLTASEAQKIVNCFKGLNEIGQEPETEDDHLLTRLYKRLFQGGHIDLYRTLMESWTSKPVSAVRKNGFYMDVYSFDGRTKFIDLAEKCGARRYYNADDLPTFFIHESNEANQIIIDLFKEFTPAEPEVSDEYDSIQQFSFDVVKSHVTFLESLLESQKGTPFEYAIADLLDDARDIAEVTDISVAEELYDQAMDEYDNFAQYMNNPTMALHMASVVRSLDACKEAAVKYTSDKHQKQLQAQIEKIEETLKTFWEIDFWRFPSVAAELWRETSYIIEHAALDEGHGTQNDSEHPDVPVLDQKPQTKTGRIMQILQDEADELHEISSSCRKCQFFNPAGTTYRERCMASSITFHSFKLFVVDGKEAYKCYEYTPKVEVIQQKKAAANMDHQLAMFELLLYWPSYSYQPPDHSWAKKEIPELLDVECTPDNLMAIFKDLDDASRAYWIEVFCRYFQFQNALSKEFPHPLYTAEGKRFMIQGDDI